MVFEMCRVHSRLKRIGSFNSISQSNRAVAVYTALTLPYLGSMKAVWDQVYDLPIKSIHRCSMREPCGSMVEYLTRDRGTGGLSLSNITVL